MNESNKKSLTDMFLELIGCTETEQYTWYLAESVDYADLERRLERVGRRTPGGLFS